MDMRRWRWTENLAVGNAKLDGGHRRFSELLHDLDDAIAAGGTGPVEQRLKAIALDALEHFDSEERAFDEHRYPGRGPHVKAHGEIRRILGSRVLGGSNAIDPAATELLSAENLRSLVVSHLLYEDLPFCEWLQSRLP
jgi:hemerythrin-like metal-binding protein